MATSYSFTGFRRNRLPYLISVSLGTLVILGTLAPAGAATLTVTDSSQQNGLYTGNPGDHLVVTGPDTLFATQNYREYSQFNLDLKGTLMDVQQGASVGSLQMSDQSTANIGVGDTVAAHTGYLGVFSNSILHLDNAIVLGQHSPNDDVTIGSALMVSGSTATLTKNTLIDNRSDTDAYAWGAFVEDGGTLTATGSTILAAGAGLTADSGGTATLNNTTITGGLRGVSAASGATVTIAGGTITATNSNDTIGQFDGYQGQYAAGVRVLGTVDPTLPSSAVTVDISNGALIQATGAQSVGLLSENSGAEATISVSNSTVSGHDAGLLLNKLVRPDRQSTVAGLTTVRLINTLVQSSAGPAVQTEGGTKTALFLSNGTQLNGANGVALQTNADSQTDVTVDNAQIAGNVVNTGGTTSISLANAAGWTGTMSAVSALTLNTGTQWQLTGNSSVSGNLANGGTVALGNGSAAGNTLTVGGNYAGNNGTLRFNTALGGDTSATDKLVVQGNTSGTTNVVVANAGGSGAPTLNGIELIQVGGQSAGDFVQQGRIVAGAYDYDLVRGQGSNAANWYLDSRLDVSPTPTPSPVVNKVRPEPGAYIANLAAANTLFLLSLHDRLGEPGYTENGETGSLWLRQVGGHNTFRDSSGQLKTQSNSYVVQLGGDVMQGSFNGQDRYSVGVMAGYGNNHNNTRAQSGYRADGRVNGYSVGLYGTWYEHADDKTGLYVDTWALYNWFNNHVSGDDIDDESYKSKGFTASVETGYTFRLGTSGHADNPVNWFFRPSAQVTWMGVKADSLTESNGTRVDGTGDNNVQMRLGGRVYLQGHSQRDKDNDRLFQPFVEANWIYNTKQFGVNLNDVALTQAGTRNIGELKVGVEGKLSRNLQLWGHVGQQMGDRGYANTTGMLGVKYAF